MDSISVALIEDNRLLREGLAALLAPLPDITVVVALGERGRTISAIREKKPQVLLLDMGLRVQSSLHLVKQLCKEVPATRVIVMDLLPTQHDVFDYIEAGVAGFVMKDATMVELIDAIHRVAKGENVLPEQLTESLFSQIVHHAMRSRKTRLLNQAVRMTRREREVVALVSEGLTNKEIAARLNLSLHTVKSHIHNVLEKLSLRSRVQIASLIHDRTDPTTLAEHFRTPGSAAARKEN